MEEFQPFAITQQDIYQDLNGYSVQFTLPDGQSVKLTHKDQHMLLKAAKDLYLGRLKRNDHASV